MKTKNQSILFVTFVCCAAAVGGLLYGYDTAVISGAIGFIGEKFSLTPGLQGFVVSSILIGGAIGVFYSGKLSDKFGRKKVLILSALLFVISAILQAVANSVFLLIFSRLFGGLGVGAASVLSVTYISEIAPANLRGRLATIYQFAVGIGITGSYFVNFAIMSGQSEIWNIDLGWRYMLAFSGLPALLFLLVLIPVPESPRWLVKQGKDKEAKSILTRVNGKDTAEIEYNEIKHSIKNKSNVKFKTIFQPKYRRVTFLAIFLAVLQQLVGINAIIYYAPQVFESAGATGEWAFIIPLLIGVVGTIGVLISMWLVDKVGRRTLTLVGLIGMTVSLLLVGIGFQISTNSILTITAILLYLLIFNFSLGPVVWVIISEIFPNAIRGVGMSIATFLMWVANWSITQSFPSIMEYFGGSAAFYLFTVFCIVGFFFTFKYLPETKGKSLEEIEKSMVS
ncbi:sugar porter family MFS transporter [Oceanobacillus oncorhynchi subsp. oncorhynchi]|uniref:sugar porter family MFS transporter n=1 Tax=Oceanobacillus oncorhynchi TaxID=545501 RepID=UPI0036260637